MFNLLILISNRVESRTPEATKIEIVVSTINDSQSLIVVTKKFVIDAIGVVNPRDRLQKGL